MAKVAIVNLYGIKDGSKSYFRKSGDCFDFVWKREYASDLTIEECKTILKDYKWYLEQYNASDMVVEG